MYQNFKLYHSWDTYFIYKKMSTYSEELLTVNMIISLGGMLKFSSTKMFSSFYNIAFEEKTIVKKKICSSNYWQSWSMHRKVFSKSFLFKMPTVLDKWKVILIPLPFKSAPLTWLIDMAFNTWLYLHSTVIIWKYWFESRRILNNY